MAFRRAFPVASVLWTGPAASGRASALFFSRAATPSAISPFHGNAGSLRSMSDGGGGIRPPLQQAWEVSRLWFGQKRAQYSKMNAVLKESDEFIKTMLQFGSYIYMGTGLVISGVIYLVDSRIDPKVNGRCKQVEDKLKEESKNTQSFQHRAICDFQDHKSKMQAELYIIQSDVNKLRQKVIDNKEDEMDHRQQLAKAENFFRLHGYLVLSNEDFASLVRKVDALEKKLLKENTSNELEWKTNSQNEKQEKKNSSYDILEKNSSKTVEQEKKNSTSDILQKNSSQVDGLGEEVPKDALSNASSAVHSQDGKTP